VTATEPPGPYEAKIPRNDLPVSRDLPFSICGRCQSPMPLEDSPSHCHEECVDR
jgi:hypothetical protein